MKLSIIIPCLNEENYIEQCINSIFNNDYPKKDFEVIIVDGVSTDNTLNIIDELKKNHKNLSVISNPKKTAPTAMNLGIKAAKGEIVMRMDAHSFYPHHYISTLLEWKDKLKADNIGALWETDVLNKNKISNAIKIILTNKFGVGNGLFRIGVDDPIEVDTVPFGCYDKEIFEKVGYYNENLIRNQDIELNKRLKAKGMKVFLIPFTFCRYYARESYRKIAHNNYRNGYWNMLTIFYTKNIKSLSIRHLVPLLFVLSLALPAVGAIFYPPLIFLSIASLILYITSLIIVISKISLKGTTFLHVLFGFLVLHLSYGGGSLIGLTRIGILFKK